jgi:dephospho-CoA kinase
LSLLVALTGNIASGKSAVARRFAERGATIIDADLLAREAVARGSEALAAIVQRWGGDMLTPEGDLSRAALRRRVFGDREALDALNAIVHPKVEALRREAIDAARRAGASVIVCDIPLLYEVGLEGQFDVVVLVDAPEGERLDRLVAKRGLSRDEAIDMIRAQMPAEDKRPRADYVIDNVGSFDALDARVEAVWRALLRRAEPS